MKIACQRLKKILRRYRNLNEIEKDLLDPEDITIKLTELENRSIRYNLRIDSWQHWRNKHQVLGTLWREISEKEKLQIEKNIEIDRCHRAGKK